MTTAAALRPWAVSRDTAREFRLMVSAAALASPAVVVLVGATIAPEVVPRGRWRTVGPHRVAVVDLDTACSLAAGRSPSAARAMRAPPSSPRAVLCLALAASGDAVTWEHLLRPAHHDPPSRPAPTFGEQGAQRTLPWGRGGDA